MKLLPDCTLKLPSKLPFDNGPGSKPAAGCVGFVRSAVCCERCVPTLLLPAAIRGREDADWLN